MSPRFYYIRDASVFYEVEVFVGIESLQELDVCHSPYVED